MNAGNSLLLDTCVWLDGYLAPELLRPNVQDLIAGQQEIHVSAISLIEIARKEARAELSFGMTLASWFDMALPRGRFKLAEITSDIAIDSSRLPDWDHKDPADQIIVATARVLGLTLITSDKRILAYPHVRSVSSRK